MMRFYKTSGMKLVRQSNVESETLSDSVFTNESYSVFSAESVSNNQRVLEQRDRMIRNRERILKENWSNIRRKYFWVFF